MGSNRMAEVSKSRPCPICGHNHACKFLTDDKGKTSVMCLREHERMGIIGTDGEKYKWSADSKDGGWSIYRPFIPNMQQTGNRAYSGNRKASENIHEGKREPEFRRPIAQKTEPKEDEIKPLPNERMNEICRFIQGKLVLDERHRQYLKSAGWPDMLMLLHGVKSFPEADRIRSIYGVRSGSRNPSRKELAAACEGRFGKGCLKGFPGAFVGKDGDWTFSGPSGIMFPMYDPDGNIFRLRIRMDWLDLDRKLFMMPRDPKYSARFEYEGDEYLVSMKGIFKKENGSVYRLDDDTCGRKGKYRTLSSYAAGEEGKNIYTCGTRSANEASVYTRNGDMSGLCYIVEGEPKSIYSNFRLKAPVVSVPGVNSYDVLFRNGIIDAMVSKGTALFVVAYDADKETNQMVMDFEGRLVKALKDKGVKAAIADWNQKDGKGLDDLLANGGTPSFRIM